MLLCGEAMFSSLAIFLTKRDTWEIAFVFLFANKVSSTCSNVSKNFCIPYSCRNAVFLTSMPTKGLTQLT
jgi:hypothetical protein